MLEVSLPPTSVTRSDHDWVWAIQLQSDCSMLLVLDKVVIFW